MEDVKRIDEANETHAVTGRWRLVIQIVSGKQVVCKPVLYFGVGSTPGISKNTLIQFSDLEQGYCT